MPPRQFLKVFLYFCSTLVRMFWFVETNEHKFRSYKAAPRYVCALSRRPKLLLYTYIIKQGFQETAPIVRKKEKEKKKKREVLNMGIGR